MDESFARIAELRREKLHGRDHNGRWTMHRYAVELHTNQAGSWTAAIHDWGSEQLGRPPGAAYAIGIHADPQVAISRALDELEHLSSVGGKSASG